MYYYPQSNNYYPQINNGYQQSALKGRPVTSLDEVKAAQIDFDGSLFIFPDLAHNRIYTKAIGMDGSASLNMYELSQIPSPASEVETSNFVTRDEFNDVVTQLKDALTKVNTSTTKEEEKEKPHFNF